MDSIRWPGLLRRVKDRRIADLYYDPDDGAVWVIFRNGEALRIEADWEGCHITALTRHEHHIDGRPSQQN